MAGTRRRHRATAGEVEEATPADLEGPTATPSGRRPASTAATEAAIFTLFDVVSHSGAVIVPQGYTDPVLFEAGGNPYGVSHASGCESPRPARPSRPPLGTRAAGSPR